MVLLISKKDMNMLKQLTGIAVLGLCAGQAMAQELTYAAGGIELEQYRQSGSGDELSITALSGEAELTFGNIFASFYASNYSMDDGPFDSLSEVSGSVGYMITPDVLVGAGLYYLTDGDGNDADGFEVFGQYETGQFGVAVRYLQPNTDESDFYFTQFMASAAVTPETEVFGVYESYGDTGEGTYYLGADYDAGSYFAGGYYAAYSEADFAFFGVDGGYRFNDQITASLGFQTIVGDSSIDYQAYKVGGSYEFIDGLSADAHFSMFGGDSGFEDVTAFGLSLTYEMGEQKRLDQRLFSDAKDDLGQGELAFIPFQQFGLIPFGI